MKLGMVGCDVRRKTLMASSLIDGIRLMSTKLGAPDFGPGFGAVALIWWQALQTVSARCRPTEGSADCALDAFMLAKASARKPIEMKSAVATAGLVIVHFEALSVGPMPWAPLALLTPCRSG